jgi:phenylalanyl-tRNA synthetase beta chain
MYFLRSWVQDYIDVSPYSDSDLSSTISLHTAEVDEFVRITDYFDGKVVVGKIENTRNHPDADRLKVFDVDLGDNGRVQIVSAARNVRDGLICPVAMVGARLPYITIAERKMRGELSQGMCCGMDELCLVTEPSEGLWELNNEVDNIESLLGQSICSVFPDLFIPDTLFDIKFLPDKIGAFGNHLGLALELSKFLGQDKLTTKAQRLLDSDICLEQLQSLLVQSPDSQLNINFVDKTNLTKAFFMFDVDLNPAKQSQFRFYIPHLIRKRMLLTVKNQLGSVADLSNYLLSDIGQPTHFFSTDKILKLNANSLDINLAIEQKSSPHNFKGLGNMSDVQIPVGVEVLTLEDNILAIPAISGGHSSKVEEIDSKILIEIASFDTEMVAQNSFDLNYRSEAARIWNGGVQPSLILTWILSFVDILNSNDIPFDMRLALSFINPSTNLGQEAVGSVLSIEKFRDLIEYQYSSHRQFKVDFEYICNRLPLPKNTANISLIESILEKLGSYKDQILTPNIFYSQIRTQEDILFAVAEIIGLENIQNQELRSILKAPSNDLLFNESNLKNLCKEFGFTEFRNRPFEDEKMSQIYPQGISIKALQAQRSFEPFLRQNFTSSLLKNLADNLNRGYNPIRIFEIGESYFKTNQQLVDQHLLQLVEQTEDPYRLTSFIQGYINLTSTEVSDIENLENKLGKGFVYNLANQEKIELIEITNKLKKTLSIPTSKKIFTLVVYRNLNLSRFYNYPKFADVSDFPSISRAYGIIVDKVTKWQGIQQLLNYGLDTDVLCEFEPIERFSLDQGRDVVNFKIQFYSFDRTVQGKEVEDFEANFIKNLQKIDPIASFR